MIQTHTQAPWYNLDFAVGKIRRIAPVPAVE